MGALAPASCNTALDPSLVSAQPPPPPSPAPLVTVGRGVKDSLDVAGVSVAVGEAGWEGGGQTERWLSVLWAVPHPPPQVAPATALCVKERVRNAVGPP